MWPEILVYIYMYTDIYLDDIYIYIHLILHIIHKKTLHVRLNNCPNVTSFCNTFLSLKGSEKTYTLCDLPEGRREKHNRPFKPRLPGCQDHLERFVFGIAMMGPSKRKAFGWWTT